MGQLKKSPGVKPAVDLFTGVLILYVVVGLPVVGWFYYDVERLRTSFSESLRVCLGDQPISLWALCAE